MMMIIHERARATTTRNVRMILLMLISALRMF